MAREALSRLRPGNLLCTAPVRLLHGSAVLRMPAVPANSSDHVSSCMNPAQGTRAGSPVGSC
eukprot:354857-Chlamydomonas_euryale.AAC.26